LENDLEMTGNNIRRIICVLIMSVMIMPAACFAEAGAAGAPGSDLISGEATDAELQSEDSVSEDTQSEELSGDADSGDAIQSGETQSEGTGDEGSEGVEPQGDEPQDEEAGPVLTPVIDLNRNCKIRIRWDAVEGASSYVVTKKVTSAYNHKKTFREGSPTYVTEDTHIIFRNLYLTRRYTFTVKATDSDGNVIAESEAVSDQPVVSEHVWKNRKSRSIRPEKLYFANGRDNLREYIKQKNGGYAVVQGGCTDGKYAYYLMISTETQHGKIAKVRMRDGKLIKVSKVLNVWHGNGMTYDSKRKQLVVTSRDEPDRKVYRKQEITCINAKTLKIIKSRQKKVRYTYFRGDHRNFTPAYRRCGLASIAYSPKYDVYIADQRIAHNLIIIDPDTFEAIGMVRTKIIRKYPAVYQGMDADDQYAYLLLSSDGRKQKKNLIIALDWHANVLVDRHGHKRQYVPEVWKCRNSAKPAAVYTIKTPHEAENIYHTTDDSGRTHVYMSEYYYDNNFTEYTIRKKSGGKYRIITKRVSPCRNRLDYVYDLGII
jgi:hypothetical protein